MEYMTLEEIDNLWTESTSFSTQFLYQEKFESLGMVEHDYNPSYMVGIRRLRPQGWSWAKSRRLYLKNNYNKQGWVHGLISRALASQASIRA
jgi:hypothetical protein